MNSHEISELHDQPAREQRPDRLFSRRALLKGAGATAAAVIGTSLVRCGTESSPPLPASEAAGSPTADVALTPTSTPEPTPTPEPKRDPNSLRELASKAGLTVGSLIQEGGLKDSKWQKITAAQFNLGRIARFDWSEVEPQRGKYNFSLIDKMVDFGQSAGMKLVAENVILGASPNGSAIPKWLSGGDFSAQDIEDILRNHISTVMTRYKGKFDKWGIVSEAALPTRKGVSSFLFDTLGWDYMRIAYDQARRTDPQTTFLYTDTLDHVAQDPGTRQIIAINKEIIARLREAGLVDDKFVLGVEGHLHGDEPFSSEGITNTLRGYGVKKIMITEFTVDMSKVSGSPGQLGEMQAARYSSFLQTVYDTGLCRDFSFETTGDKLNGQQQIYGPSASPTMYDVNLDPKPAYKAVQDFFRARAAEAKN
jgi:endo-1,4-beta-xylanase